MILIITGPPGAGKTTVSRELLKEFNKGFHLPLDDIRHWVVSGLEDSTDWTEETDRQFRIAERAACAMASEYAESGFTVAFDHCRNLPRLNQMVEEHLPKHTIIKVCLVPDQEVNLQRNQTRTNKSFDTGELTEIIQGMQTHYREADRAGWLVIDSSQMTVQEVVNEILKSVPGP